MKRGILFLNLGGPANLDEVTPFLYRLFSDPDILVGIPTPLRKMLAFLISRIKGPSSRRIYSLIGGGSPQLRWTQAQAVALEKLLQTNSIGSAPEIRVAIGMRAAHPFIETGLKDLFDWGAEEIVLFPLFPHFSTTTTGSCFKEVFRILQNWEWTPKIIKISSWADYPDYIDLWRQVLLESIQEWELKRGNDQPLHILFSAHSLPMKIVDRGDPYPSEVALTVRALTQGLSLPWSLAFQSRNGPVPWLKPYTEQELESLGASGVKNVLIVPLSFVSDHIETLFELDILYRDIAQKSGISGYYRTPMFNDDPRFSRVLQRLLFDTVQTKPIQLK